MKKIICFSGGHSSAIAAIETVRKYGPGGVILLNHDIPPLVEHEDIKRFKKEIADYLHLPITYANMPGWETMTPLDVAVKCGAFKAYNHPAFCTSRLKTEPFYRYLSQNSTPGDWIIYGFDPRETDRMERRKALLARMGYQAVFPLADWERTIFATEEIGISRPSTYSVYKHANCIGCLKAGRQHWYCVYCLRPDIWKKAKAAEEKIGHSIIKGVYLKELEPKFQDMRDHLHICPTEQTNAAAFWAGVRKALPTNNKIEKEALSALESYLSYQQR